MYFQFDTETNIFIRAFEKPCTFSFKRDGDVYTAGIDHFKLSNSELLKIGIKVGSIVKPEITDDSMKYGAPTDDEVNLTRTYPVVQKSDEMIANETLGEQIKTYEDKLESLNESDKLMARISEDLIDVLITKGVIVEDDIAKKDVLTDRKAVRASLGTDPRPLLDEAVK